MGSGTRSAAPPARSPSPRRMREPFERTGTATNHIESLRPPRRNERPPHTPASGDAVERRQSVEGEAEHQLACPRRPAEGRFRIAHAFACANYAPKDIGQ